MVARRVLPKPKTPVYLMDTYCYKGPDQLRSMLTITISVVCMCLVDCERQWNPSDKRLTGMLPCSLKVPHAGFIEQGRTRGVSDSDYRLVKTADWFANLAHTAWQSKGPLLSMHK